MRVFIPLILMYGASWFLLTTLANRINSKLAFYAAIFTTILTANLAIISYLLDQGFVGTQFFLPLLVILSIIGLYHIAKFLANKGK